MYQTNGQCSVVKHLGDLFFYRFRYNAVCISIIIYLSAERIHMSKMMLPSFYLILIWEFEHCQENCITKTAVLLSDKRALDENSCKSKPHP